MAYIITNPAFIITAPASGPRLIDSSNRLSRMFCMYGIEAVIASRLWQSVFPPRNRYCTAPGRLRYTPNGDFPMAGDHRSALRPQSRTGVDVKDAHTWTTPPPCAYGAYSYRSDSHGHHRQPWVHSQRLQPGERRQRHSKRGTLSGARARILT